MTRLWNELVAAWADVFPLSLTVLLLLVSSVVVGLLWFFWPRWWHALRWPRRRRKGERDQRNRIRIVTDAEMDSIVESDEELPDAEPAVFLALADRLAAEGRYAEAIRERLRAMVREMIDYGIISHRPGWTVTELATAAGTVRPGLLPPLTEATDIFSTIWYGKRPALAEHDTRMRTLAQQLWAETGAGVGAR